MFRMDFGNGDALSLQTYKEWVSVNAKAGRGENFKDALGLMGSFAGEMVGRDLTTVFEDPNAFGKEWQVLPTEPMLFHDYSNVKASEECAMPTEKTAEQRTRRLGESPVSQEDAEVACARADEEDRDACIFDVLATFDKDTASAY